MLSERHILTQGYSQAKAITRHYAKTFYFAARFLPAQKQNAAFSIYAICRISDESVDGKNDQLRLRNLEAVKAAIEDCYSGRPPDEPLLAAFKETVGNYAIPKTYFDELIQGMYMDVEKTRYATFDELYTYCYKVAGVVGLIMLKVLGYRSQVAEKHAVNLGIAMQLTNILRDIKEDFSRGRVYLPQDELGNFGVSENDIAGETVDGHFKMLLGFCIHRARRFYGEATPGIALIDNVPCRIVVFMMKDLYAGILDEIEKNGCDVFSRRARVSTLGKLNRTVAMLAKGKYL